MNVAIPDRSKESDRSVARLWRIKGETAKSSKRSTCAKHAKSPTNTALLFLLALAVNGRSASPTCTACPSWKDEVVPGALDTVQYRMAFLCSGCS